MKTNPRHQAACLPCCRIAWTFAAMILLSVANAPNRLLAAEGPANVVVITIDTLRADHLGCYGDHSIATPNLDALARGAARFTHAFTPVPITLPAHTALFTGSFPMATGVHDFSGNKVPTSAVTLAKVLRDHGYSTAAFLGAAVLDSRFGLNQGFDTYFDHFDFDRLDETNLDMAKRGGDQVIDNALEWLKANPRRPFFLWVHLYDAHYPYTPPEPYATRYAGRPYDGEIAFDDAQVGRLIAFLRELGLFDNTVLAVAGDHGEGLGEHGEKTHGFFVYNSTLHIPLFVRVPGAGARTIEKEASLVDVMPTLLQALHLPIPPSVQGRSLLGDVVGKPSPSASNLYAETYLPLLHFHWSQLRALQSGGLKYIEAPRPELYDTRTDPHESRNLLPGKQALSHEMRDRLQTLERRYTPASGGGARETEATDPALADRLRSLGYVAISGGSFSDASGKALPDPKDRIRVYDLFSQAMADGQHGRYTESLAKLGEAEKTEPSSLPVRYLQALDYFRLKDFPRAMERFKSALELDPKFSLATYYLGLTQIQAGDMNAATASLQHALELDPTNFAAAYNLGTLELKQNRVQHGLHHFEQAAQINPNYAPAFEALGELYLYLHRNDDAVRSLEHAVAVAPSLAKAHYNLGRAYQAVGRTADAQNEFARAQSLHTP
ncbi:MAG: sulfatase-like hydrolase/transferase [Acidobacteriota bacterium]|nr:sulfatase-like hydrolase/transferase [Acidobacteriota bacterium]